MIKGPELLQVISIEEDLLPKTLALNKILPQHQVKVQDSHHILLIVIKVESQRDHLHESIKEGSLVNNQISQSSQLESLSHHNLTDLK
jgi:hypothetical protein